MILCCRSRTTGTGDGTCRSQPSSPVHERPLHHMELLDMLANTGTKTRSIPSSDRCDDLHAVISCMCCSGDLRQHSHQPCLPPTSCPIMPPNIAAMGLRSPVALYESSLRVSSSTDSPCPEAVLSLRAATSTAEASASDAGAGSRLCSA